MVPAKKILSVPVLSTAMLASFASGVAVSCSSTPNPISIRTFEQPQKMTVVCLNVNASGGAALPEVKPVPLGACPPVPPNTLGAPLENHLLALVTQHTQGQLGVVDMTSGNVVDEDRSTPGTDLIPVGAEPSDVVATPDALVQQPPDGGAGYPPLVFVSSDYIDTPWIYAIPEARLLGDETGTETPLVDGGVADVSPTPLKLTDLLACSLPQRAQALGVTTLPAGGPPYVVVALLRAFAGAPARIVAIDPTPFPSQAPGALPTCTILGSTTFEGLTATPPAAGVTWSDGVPFADAGDLSATEPPLGPTCMSTVPVDAGEGSTSEPDASGTSIVEAGAPDGGASDADALGASAFEAAAPAGGSTGSVDAGVTAAVNLPPPAPLPTALLVRDDTPMAYVADGAVPVIHVIDLSNPASPVEVGQLVATSAANPSRSVSIGGIALSPPTSDFHRYLYAIDSYDGTVMVFDATSPTPQVPPQTPMRRPHPELNPFAPVDRIAFAAPAESIAFATHDWPLVPPAPNTDSVNAYTGLLCNPNPNAVPDGGVGFVDGGLGGYYRGDQSTVIEPEGAGIEGFPSRLRGVFAFVTLSNGSMVTVDVDDWDAPCRRPDPMDTDGGAPDFQLGALDLPEPAPSGPGDIDPYHTPNSVVLNGQTGVTQETFYPVSAPNRIRSGSLLRNDATSGDHMPYVSTPPTIFDATGAPVSYSVGGTVSLILPTALAPGYVDPSYIEDPTDPHLAYTYSSTALGTAVGQSATPGVLFPGTGSVPGVRVSYDDPTVHQDQDWTVTYEGVLPTANGVFADMTSADGSYETLTFAPAPAAPGTTTSNGAQFCERGIEDWNVGRARATAALNAMTAAGLAPSPTALTLPTWTADYVEITDDLLDSTDPYWNEPNPPSCWDGLELSDSNQTRLDDNSNPNIGTIRYNACFQAYNSSENADTYYARDFPILQATDNALVVGRFGWPPTVGDADGGADAGAQDFEQTNNRTIVGADPSNAPFLKLATCCFHQNAGFKVRAGGEWLTVGQIGANPGLGLLHHVVPDPATGACVIRCDDPSKVLMNARTFDIASPSSACNAATSNGMFPAPIGRDSSLAMRNPILSFVMWGPCGDPPAPSHTYTTRDLQWRFSIRGSFNPLSTAIQGTSPVPVSPQSMFYIAPFGQLAIVDGATSGQGLVLIDLNTLAFAHSPYF